MALYAKQFSKPYPAGYVDKPQKTTPVTAEILNMQDKVFGALENFLTSDDVGFKKGLTIGQRQGTSSEIGNFSLVIGTGKSSGQASCSFGQSNTVSGDNASAFGQNNTASGINAAAYGAGCEASGILSYAAGSGAKAKGSVSHVEGDNTIASGAVQHVQGKYNIEDTENQYAHIVGGGTYQERRNIHTLDWNGNAKFAGDVTNGNGVSLDGLMALIGTTGQLRTIVDVLPEEDIFTNTIYMVLKEYGSKNDIYNEYINVDGTPEGWEFIGNSAIDLSDYYTKTQTDHLLSGYVQTETGKGLSSNDYADEEKHLLESIRSMTAEDALAILNGEVE